MEVETYCGLALSGQRSGRYSGLCVQVVGSGLRGQRLQARDESALEVAWPPDRGFINMLPTVLEDFYKWWCWPAIQFQWSVYVTCELSSSALSSCPSSPSPCPDMLYHIKTCHDKLWDMVERLHHRRTQNTCVAWVSVKVYASYDILLCPKSGLDILRYHRWTRRDSSCLVHTPFPTSWSACRYQLPVSVRAVVGPLRGAVNKFWA